jgi:hypothetical protein
MEVIFENEKRWKVEKIKKDYLDMDITMTAVRRPKVIEKTLKSFTENLFVVPEDHTLIVNVDPIGEGTHREVVEVCTKYFPNTCIYGPDEPSFPKAVIKLWKMVSTDFFFHLEDDWVLERPIFESDLVNPLKRNKDLACMRLYKENIPNSNNPTMFGARYKYHNNYFTPIPGSNNWKNQFGLNPVLIRKKFIDEALPLMVGDQNPEKQFRENNPLMKNILSKWTFAIYGRPGQKRMVWGKNGLHWRQKSKYKKPRDGSGFTTWAKR